MSDESVVPSAAAAEADEPAAKPKKAKKAPAKGKGADGKGAKGKGAKGKGKGSSSGGISIASHPRARAQVRRAKGWSGLAGFGIGAYLSFKAGIPFQLVMLRAIAAGIALYMVAWACSLTVWRHLVLAELRAMSERHDRARAAATSGSTEADKNPTSKPAQ